MKCQACGLTGEHECLSECVAALRGILERVLQHHDFTAQVLQAAQADRELLIQRLDAAPSPSSALPVPLYPSEGYAP